jgi:hypothetical protein
MKNRSEGDNAGARCPVPGAIHHHELMLDEKTFRQHRLHATRAEQSDECRQEMRQEK